MRKYNEKHEAIIYHDFEILESNPKDGEMADFQSKAQIIEFYREVKNGKFIKVRVNRDFIFDLHEQILEIEKEKKREVFVDLPY